MKPHDTAVREHRRRRVKRAAGVSAIGVIGWFVFAVATTWLLNRKSMEDRFEDAYRDIASGPRQQVFQLVLLHERIVRALAARGAVRPPLVLTEGGVEDPILQEALRPSTLLEKAKLQSRSGQEPQELSRRLQDRNAQLLSQLAGAGGSASDLQPSEVDAEPAPMDPSLQLGPIVRSARSAVPQPRFTALSVTAADRLKALCVAQGGSVSQFRDLCNHPEELATRTRTAPVP